MLPILCILVALVMDQAEKEIKKKIQFLMMTKIKIKKETGHYGRYIHLVNFIFITKKIFHLILQSLILIY